MTVGLSLCRHCFVYCVLVAVIVKTVNQNENKGGYRERIRRERERGGLMKQIVEVYCQ